MGTNRVLTVVSCGSSKQNLAGIETVPARKLYSSTVHQCKDRYGRHSAGYYIMSARYGLVRHDKRLPYYDQTLDEMDADAVATWGSEVASDLSRVVEKECYEAVVLIGGETYVEAVLEQIGRLGVPVLTPWQTVDAVSGVGRGMSWCSDESNWPCNVDDVSDICESRAVEPAIGSFGGGSA